jgi:hypothetical protein
MEEGKICTIHSQEVQEEMYEVEQWALMWGFRFSVEKLRQCSLPGGTWEMRLYGRELESVGVFRFLWVYFDIRLTWAEHIERVVGKCKKVLNVMHCLTGMEWGGSPDLTEKMSYRH